MRLVNGQLTRQERQDLIDQNIGEAAAETLRDTNTTRKDLLLAQIDDTISEYMKSADTKNLSASALQAFENERSKASSAARDEVYFTIDDALRNSNSEKAVNSVTRVLDKYAKALSNLVTKYADKPNEKVYRFVTEPGSKSGTCEACEAHNGKLYTMDGAEELGAKPPLHPNCKCKLVEVRGALSASETARINAGEKRLAAADGKENQKKAELSSNDLIQHRNITSERLKLGLGILKGDIMPIKDGRYISNGAYFNINNLDPLVGFSATEHIEIYVALAGETDNPLVKTGLSLQILAAEPQKMFEAIASMYKNQALMAGFDPSSSEAYGNVMGGYAVGLIITQFAESIRAVKGMGSAGNVVEGIGNLKPQNLMDDLAQSGVKYNPDDVVMVTKTPDGKLLWLENGSNSAGLKHIVNGKAADFANKGITDIPNFLQQTLQNAPINTGIGTRGPFAEYLINGSTYRVAYGTNGFIVSFYPIS